MTTNAALVDEFHRSFRLPVVDFPDRVEVNLRVLREEVNELADAMADGDRVAATHELADVVYVAYEIAATYSLPLDAAFARVHRANMSKLDDNGSPVFRADGKVLKGPNYQPPNITELVEDSPERQVDRDVYTVARAVLNSVAQTADWGDYPDIGEHDWRRVVDKVDDLAFWPDGYGAAYDRLAERANGIGL